MYSIPTDSITAGSFLNTIASSTVVSGTTNKTILSIGMASGGGNAELYCGSNVIATIVKSSNGVSFTNIDCPFPIYFKNLSNSDASVIINYVPYDTHNLSTSTSLSVSTTPIMPVYATSTEMFYQSATFFFFLLSFVIITGIMAYVARRLM